MNRLIMVSNRLPVNFAKRHGKLKLQPSVGGLVTGISSFFESNRGIWVGWPGIPSDRLKTNERREISKKLRKESYHPIFLTQHYIENYYGGFCNKTIWPLFHYFTQYTEYSKKTWEAYRRVNKIFCDKIVKVAKPDDIIWVHDYHLMLLPELIREKLPKITIGYFLHIPFPSYEVFHHLPWREDIVSGLLGADLIGFHTYDYVRHFLNCVRRMFGYERTLGRLSVGERMIKADIFPMGIDYKRFKDALHTPEVKKEMDKIRKKVGKRKIILSVDRLDYTKGILQRLEAYDYFLEKNKKYRGKVTLILVAVPSRTKVIHYRMLKRKLDELVGRINGKHGTMGWMPVWYLYSSLPFHELVALYNAGDIALVTPLRDGMNLIAKEFIATKQDGKAVLILSEMAGASQEMGEAIIVNPHNKERIADAIKEALTIPVEIQQENNKKMQQRLKRYDIVRWVEDFMDTLSTIKKVQRNIGARVLVSKAKKNLLKDYYQSKNRLILLDYDGTLVPFSEDPEKVVPDKKLTNSLVNLIRDTKNEIVIVSGRPRETLEKWFKDLDVSLIAEHGVWIKKKGKRWKTIETLRSDWKEDIRALLELYMDRTPGSFVEEKDYSLVWHYRKVDPALGLVRTAELKDFLLHLTGNLDIGVLEGNKVIEVKNAGVNKGAAVAKWLSKKKWDFILAVGDDRTDEDVFDVLPDHAYSIRVGLCISKAKFSVTGHKQVRNLLKELGSQ